jgi:outer membrane protein OmpA-like peptidoglycan-associated protein
MSSLQQSLEGMLMPDVVDQIGTKFGISNNVVKGGVGSLTKELVGGLSNKAKDPQAMSSLAGLINEAPDERPDISRAINDENSPMRQRGAKLLSLATDDQSGLAGRVTRSMGLSGGAATGMLGTVAALVMGGLRKFGAGRNLDASSLGTLLRAETSFGNGKEAARKPEVSRGAAHTAADLAVHHKRPWWLLWQLAAAVAVIAIWAGMRGRHARNAELTQPSVEARRPPATNPTRPTTPNAPSMGAPPGEAPTGQAPSAQPPAGQPPSAQAPAQPTPSVQGETFPAGSGEAALLHNLRAPNPSDAWITLDGVKFDTGSAALDPASATQLGHVAEILKSHPNARIKIGGYTDATGTPEANMKLSHARAESVQKALADDGVDANRMEVVGFGQNRPAEATGGASDVNRRVAIQVTAR